MTDPEKPDISTAMSLLQLSDSRSSATGASGATTISSISSYEAHTHDHVKKEDQEATLSNECDKKEGIIAAIQSQLEAGAKVKHNLRIDCCTKLLTHTPVSTPIESPAAKGDYIIGPGAVDMLLGKCQYFVAPIDVQFGTVEYSVFSISTSKNLVSYVDDQSHHSDADFILSCDASNPTSWFAIGARMYYRDEGHSGLNWVLISGAQSGVTILHDNLDGARRECDSMRQSVSAEATPTNNPVFAGYHAQSLGQTPSLDKPVVVESDCTPRASNNLALFCSLNGHGQGNGSIVFSPSPPDTTAYSPGSPQTTYRGNPDGPLKFGKQARRDDIDAWVNKAAASRQWSTPNGKIRCPESGCNASSRRPHALKDHLYTHYDIRPFECEYSGCTKAFATQANMLRHYKNIHVCAGCNVKLSSDDSKRHKKTCISLVYGQSTRGQSNI